MARNVEIKARVHDFEALKRNAEQRSDTPVEILDQEDTFFCVPNGRFKLRTFPDGRGELIAYSRADEQGPAVSDYHILRTESADGIKSFLTEMLSVRGTVRKRRYLYHIGQTRIHLDDVENLGTFLELEVMLSAEEAEEVGAAIVDRILADLGVSDEDRIARAYIDLLEAKTS